MFTVTTLHSIIGIALLMKRVLNYIPVTKVNYKKNKIREDCRDNKNVHKLLKMKIKFLGIFFIVLH